MIPPGSTIGILGGGQLGRMLGMCARQLGYGVHVLTDLEDAPAAAIADRVIVAPFQDLDAGRRLAEACAVVTYEFENVPADLARVVAEHTLLRPVAELLARTQDRVVEHAWLDRLGIPTAPGRPVRSLDDLRAAVDSLGLPLRLKTARGGYDGGGQWRITDADSLARAEAVVQAGGVFLVEGEVRFQREISVVACRAVSGAFEAFPVFENHHQAGILDLTTAPAAVSEAHARQAVEIARTLAEDIRLVGTLTVECFDTEQGVLVNELAPRVHNSGHLSIEACDVSQFEQHLRAITGLPLRPPRLRAPAAMANLLGAGPARPPQLQGVDAVLARPDTHLHVYGKTLVKERRKMGHLTVLAPTVDQAREGAQAALAELRWA